MSSSNKATNIGLDAVEKCALYIEGVRCAFSSVEVSLEDGSMPRVVITLPATADIRKVSRRARVHFILEEPAPPNDLVVFFEGEIAGRGFQKSPTGRGLSFEVQHVSYHLSQFEITTLDNEAYLNALTGGSVNTENTLSTVTGSILELMTPENIANILNDPTYLVTTENDTNAAQTLAPGVSSTTRYSPGNLTFSDFVRGSFLLYKRIFSVGRVKQSYTNNAVTLHQLGARIQVPNRDIIDWGEFQQKILSSVLAYGMRAVGGKLSYLDLIQNVAQNFLHGMTILPHAESVTKQIQIKPQTYFNAIPKCNVLFPSMSESYSFNEDLTNKPTRMRVTFMPSGIGNVTPNVLQRYFTVFAPSELQWRWSQITKAGAASSPLRTSSLRDGARGTLNFEGPKDGLPFLTLEEDARGVVTTEYQMPPMLNAAIMAQVSSSARAQFEAELSGVDTADVAQSPQQAKAVLQSGSPVDRLTKYKAFLCIALGDAGGVDPARFKNGVAYIRPGKNFFRTRGNPPTSFQFVPRRMVLMPSDIATGAGNKLSPQTIDRLKASGAHYFVTKAGAVYELIQRDYQLFWETNTLPLGIRVSGVQNPDLFNSTIPPLGRSRAGASSSGEGVVQLTLNPPVSNGTAPPEFLLSPGLVRAASSVFIKLSGGDVSSDSVVKNFNGFIKANLDKTKGTPLLVTECSGDGTTTGAALSVTVVDVKTVSHAGASYLVLQVDKPLRLNTFYRIRLSGTSRTSFGKPWVFTRNPKIQETNVQTLVKAYNEQLGGAVSLGADQTNLGPVGTVLIAYETDRSGRLVGGENQSKALGFLTAAISELTAMNVGDSKAPLKAAAQRQPRINEMDIIPLRELYGVNISDLPDIPAEQLGVVRTKFKTLRDKIYLDFNSLDTQLLGGGSVAPIVFDTNPLAPGVQAVPDAEVDLVFNQAQNTAGIAVERAAAQPGQVASPTAGTTDEAQRMNFSPEVLNQVIKYYVSGYVNYQFYSARLAPQAHTGPVVFNPYILPGYPCLLLDSAATAYDLVGYVHAVNYRFTPTSIETNVTYTHLRPVFTRTDSPVDSEDLTDLREAMIPFKAPRTNVLIYVMPPNREVFNQGDAAKMYAEYIQKGTLLGKDWSQVETLDSGSNSRPVITETFLPIQLHDVESKAPPPFVFSGGFGIGKGFTEKQLVNGVKAQYRDFSSYLVFTGYNNSDNNQSASNAAGSVNEAALIFADTIKDIPRDLGVIDAYNYIRRPIQRVGQNNLRQGQASLVAWADDAAALNNVETTRKTALGISSLGADSVAAANRLATQRVTGFPDDILVYVTPPTYGADGKASTAGIPLEFNPDLQNVVRTHTLTVTSRPALWDGAR